jgi:hypothetical protein
MLACRSVNKLVLVGAAAVLVGASLVIKVGGASAGRSPGRPPRRPGTNQVNPNEPSSAPPKAPLNLLFIHHSVGGRWLADPGAKQKIAEEIWKSHPDGGGLRRQLEAQGYKVHEASYGSDIGGSTDLPDWIVKFRDKMDIVRRTELNDKVLPDGQRNQIVMFKSCFPNNLLDDDKALEAARTEMRALLPELAKHPDVLFVHVTTPPLAPRVEKEPAWKWLARELMRKPQPGPRLLRSGPLARALDDWVTSPEGWLKGYPGKNIVVFDLYDALTNHGESDFLAYPTEDGYDSHPTREGNAKAAAEFVPFLNRAVRLAGLSE